MRDHHFLSYSPEAALHNRNFRRGVRHSLSGVRWPEGEDTIKAEDSYTEEMYVQGRHFGTWAMVRQMVFDPFFPQEERQLVLNLIATAANEGVFP